LQPIRPPGVSMLVLEHVSDLCPRMAVVLPLPQDLNVARLLASPSTFPRAALQGAEQLPKPPPARCRFNLRPSEVEVRFLLRLHFRASCTPAQMNKNLQVRVSGRNSLYRRLIPLPWSCRRLHRRWCHDRSLGRNPAVALPPSLGGC
jgi:hypothetical protein